MQYKDYCLETVTTFNKFADRYAEKYFDLDIYDKYLDRFIVGIKTTGASVIDIACGPGNVSAYLGRKRPDLKVVGVDLSEAMIEQARQRVPSAEFLVEDCRTIGELNRFFDSAVFAFGLSYLVDDDAMRFFVSLNSALADGAMLYLSTITGDPEWSGFETSGSEDRVYIQYRSVKDVVSMVKRAGYKIDFMEVINSPASAPKSTKDLIIIAQLEKSELR